MKKKYKTGNRVAIYARYSSDNQRDESLSGQIRAIKSYCEQNDYSITKIYTDKAKSATSDKRPGFQSMIHDSALDAFDIVIVHKLDRFSRDRYDFAIYKQKLTKNGVRLLSVMEDFDDSPESIILRSVLEGMAEYYSKNLAREVMKGMSENAYKCMHTGGIPPLGYDIDPATKKYVINDTEAITIREIFRLYNDGNGYDKIITALNAKGYLTKKSKPFGKNSLHEIIANEKYSGVYIFNRSSSKDFEGARNNHESKDDDDVIRIDGGVPAIIAKEEFTKAKHRMIANKTGAGRYKAKELYLLSGLIFCGECGHRMQGNMRFGGRNKLKYVSYKCGGRDNCKSCDNKEIRREYIESFVLSEMERLIFNDKAIPKLIEKLEAYQSERTNDNEKESDEIKTHLRDVNIQLENIISAVASGYTKSAFKDKISELEQQKNELELRLKEIEILSPTLSVNEEMLRKMISMFEQYVKDKNISECKKFIDSFLQKVVIYIDKVEVVFKIASTSFDGQNDCLTFKTEEKIQTLFKRFKVA